MFLELHLPCFLKCMCLALNLKQLYETLVHTCMCENMSYIHHNISFSLYTATPRIALCKSQRMLKALDTMKSLHRIVLVYHHEKCLNVFFFGLETLFEFGIFFFKHFSAS